MNRPKPSDDILDERNALDARLRRVEAALSKIDEEIEHALRHPEIAYLTLCRLSALTRQLRST